MDKIKKYFNDNKIELYFISILTIVAFVIRLVAMNNIGELAYDEIASWYFAGKKSVFDTVLSLLKEDVNMPFYYIILHFWIKLFGDSEKSMHFYSLIISIPLIPLSFYLMKSLFNKTSAYYASVLFALNTFCIYYSLEVSFYGLVILFSLLASFVFVKMLEKFEKKYVISFIIIHTLLFYTFSLVSILSLFYLIVGFSYVLIKKRNIKDFVITYAIALVFALPVIVITIKNYLSLNSNICLYCAEFFRFSPYAIYDILENFFSSENYQLNEHTLGVYRDIFDNLSNLKYLFLVLVPVLISLFALIKGSLSKNMRLVLFILPSLFAFVYVILLASADAICFQTKYLVFVFPVFVCWCAFGLSLIRNKIFGVVLFCILIYLNIMYTVLSPNNILNYRNVEIGNLDKVVSNIVEIKNDDILFIPFSSNKLKMYINKGNLIPFSFDEALLLKDKDSLRFYFGDELYKKINSNNAKDVFYEYIFKNKIPLSFENNMKSKYFNNMKKNQRFIYISPYEKYTGSIDDSWNVGIENYKYASKFDLFMSKVSRDAKKLADENLKFIKKYKDDKRNYSIYIYEKN